MKVKMNVLCRNLKDTKGTFIPVWKGFGGAVPVEVYLLHTMTCYYDDFKSFFEDISHDLVECITTAFSQYQEEAKYDIIIYLEATYQIGSYTQEKCSHIYIPSEGDWNNYDYNDLVRKVYSPLIDPLTEYDYWYKLAISQQSFHPKKNSDDSVSN